MISNLRQTAFRSRTKGFGVSRVTVRLAVGKLSDDGVVERKQGKGTFVAAKQV